MADLNDKQRRFAEEYLVDKNATQAAIRAGYSPKTAHSAGPRLLGNVEVRAAIDALLSTQSKRTAITADRVLEEWARIAFASIGDVADWGEREVAIGYDADGKRLSPADLGDAAVVHHEVAPFLHLVDRDQLPEDLRAAVAEVGLTKDGFKIKMHDKLGALAKLGDHLRLAPRRSELSGPNGGPIETAPLTEDMAALPKDKRDAIRAAIKATLEGEK